MPFLSGPTRTPIAPPRSTTPVLTKASEKQEKSKTVERPATPQPTQSYTTQEAGALVPTSQYGCYDDAGFGYGYGYGFGYGQQYNQQRYGGQQGYAMGMTPFAAGTVTPSNYYNAEFNNNNTYTNYNYNNYNTLPGYGNFGGYGMPATVTSSFPQYQSMYSMPSYFNGGMHMMYMNNNNSVADTYTDVDTYSMSAASATFERASTVYSTGSFFEPTLSRSQSQPMFRRPATPPLAVAQMPVQSAFASLAPWEIIGNTMIRQENAFENAYTTPWGTTMNTPRAQTPPPSMMQFAPMGYTTGSTTSWTNESVSKTIRNELRRGLSTLTNKVQTELTAAFQPHPTRQPMMKQNLWDGSRTRNYEYRPVDRAFLDENGAPVAHVQYTGDGTAFNLTMDGVRLGGVMRHDPVGMKNPFSLGPRRGDNWIVVDRNAQTRYRIQRKAKSFYELHVLIGAHTHGPALAQHVYSCNWYQALVQGHLTVTDPSGANVATCIIGPDTGSQADRSISIQIAGGTDHPTLMSTILLALELSRNYCNEAIHPTNHTNVGKATMGFGPSVVPNLFYA